MDCPHCGKLNPTGTAVCYLCGRELARRDSAWVTGSVVGPSYAAEAPPDAALAQAAARARRFLAIIGFVILLPPLLGAVEFIAQNKIADPDPLIRQIELQLFTAGGLIYLFLIFGFLTAKTAEATGAPFASNLLLALVPPLAPGVWARIGGGSIWKPYLYFLIDGVILLGAMSVWGDRPVLALAVLVALIPFIVYQAMGCSINAAAELLGLHPLATIAWLCLAPALLAGSFVYGALIETAMPVLAVSWGQFAQEARQHFANPQTALEYFPLKVGALSYLIISLIVWVRAIYYDLRMPLN